MTRICFALICLIAASTARADALDELRSAIADRLLSMEDVARHKWNHHAPITDRAREEALLEAKIPHATALGLPEAYAERVLEAQLAAARMLQEDLTARWTAEGLDEFVDVPDLATVQRPRIDAATDRLIERVGDAVCSLADDDARERMEAVPAALTHAERAWATASGALWPLPDGLECPSASGR